MKDLIILKWNSFLLSFASIVYGFQLLLHPDIIARYRVYQLISNVASPAIIGVVFVLLGFCKLAGIITKNKRVKRFSLVSLSFVWSSLSLSFLISSPPNTIWILGLVMTVLSIGIAIREV